MSLPVSKAFQTRHVERKPEGIIGNIASQLDGAFRAAIPDTLLGMPRQAMYSIGIMSYLSCLALFLVIVLTTYGENISQVYLSPNNIPGQCNPVLTSTTGTFLADTEGNWESAVAFKPTMAVYQFSTQALMVSNQTYVNMLTNLNRSINAVAYTMYNKTLTGNLIFWTAWRTQYILQGTEIGMVDTVQYFSLYGDPGVIFNRQYLLGTISNVDADCNASSITSFSPADYMLRLDYKYDDFQSNPRCNHVVEPSQLGYNALYDGDIISLSMDMRSFVTAVAVNEGVILLTQLQQLVDTTYSFENDGIPYNVSNYYDAQYPGMTPIFCVINLATEFIQIDPQGFVLTLYNTSCGMEFPNQTYSIPLFNHFGYSPDFPSYCSCDDGLGPGATNPDCEQFDLMVGVMLYSNTDDADFSQGNPFIDIQKNIPIAMMNPAAYEAMYMAVSSHHTDKYQDPALRAQAYDFCNVSYASCTIVTMNLQDTANNAVTDYYHQLLQGSCADSISIPSGAYQRLVDTPPAALEQSYYDCKQSKVTVLTSAIGIASGNMGAVIPLVFMCFINLYYLYLSSQGKKDKRTYSKEERDEALQGLAVQLLMTRDNRYPATRRPRRTHLGVSSSNNSSRNSTFDSCDDGSGGSGGNTKNNSSSSCITASSSGAVYLPPNISILRLLTEELMENAYISTYFHEDEGEETRVSRVSGDSRAGVNIREVSNPMTQCEDADDVELANISGAGVGSGSSRLSGLVKNKPITVLNDGIDCTADTVVAFQQFCDTHGGDAGVDNSSEERAVELLRLLHTLMLRMVATTKQQEERYQQHHEEQQVEDFWSLVLHTSVLHSVNLDSMKTSALLLQTKDNNHSNSNNNNNDSISTSATTAFSNYVAVVMKIYELINWHIR